MTAEKPPQTLSAEAKRIWLKMNLKFEFEFEELLLLKVALENYDLMTKARKVLQNKGFTIKARSGTVKSNPAVRMFQIARGGFLESWKALNLNVEPAQAVGRPPGVFPKLEVGR